ncbi:MAG TPA: hypothetical protein VKE70_04250 [Candidatus Solibacter sp.]|nr:hypothetical protein [Candidatus Solibacter sp.]
MKKILILCGFTLIAIGVLAWRAAAKPSRFGTFTGAPKAEIASLISEPKNFAGKPLLVEGTITEQCKAMGCFFFFRSGNKTLRVDIQDIAMTAPMREGRRARVEGQLVRYGDGFQFYASAVEFL